VLAVRALALTEADVSRFWVSGENFTLVAFKKSFLNCFSMAQRSQDLHAHGSNVLVTNQMATPNTTGGAPLWDAGSSMLAPAISARAFSDQVFSVAGRGRWALSEPGRFPRGSRISGRQGSIDLVIDSGSNGTTRSIFSVADRMPVTRIMHIAIDTSNRPHIEWMDLGANAVARGTPSGPGNGSNTKLHIRCVWDCTTPVHGARHIRLQVNGVDVPDADWSPVDPTSPWTPFRPEYLITMEPPNLLGAFDSFNGSIESIQISNTVQSL